MDLSTPRLRFLTFGAIALWILLVAGRDRFDLPAAPLADEDVWGYLYPAVSKLTGGGFEHSLSREWPYPAFLLANLFCFNTFSAITVSQHLLGLLAGGLLLAAWRELAELVPPPRRPAAREWSAWLTGLAGLVMAGVYVLSRRAVLAEHTLRPEAVFPCFGALHLWLILGFVRRHWVLARPDRAVRWGAAALFVTVLLFLLRPAFALAVPLVNLPVFIAACAPRTPWRRRWRLVGLPAVLAAVGLLLPERLLTRGDPFSIFMMPTARFAVHADIIREQIAADLARPKGPPRYGRTWLAALLARLDLCLAHSRLPEHAWPQLGFNADYLLAVEPFTDGSFPATDDGFRAQADFCSFYYRRAWLRRPGAMLRKIAHELTVFYRFEPRGLRGKHLWRTVDPYTQQERPFLSADAYYPRTVRSLDVASQPILQERAARSDAFRDQLARCRQWAGGRARVNQPKWVGVAENVVNASYLPALLLALGAALAVALRPAWRARAGLAAAAGPLLFAYNFGMCLTVAAVQTLGTARYVEVQAVFTVFAWFGGLWLLGLAFAAALGSKAPPAAPPAVLPVPAEG